MADKHTATIYGDFLWETWKDDNNWVSASKILKVVVQSNTYSQLLFEISEVIQSNFRYLFEINQLQSFMKECDFRTSYDLKQKPAYFDVAFAIELILPPQNICESYPDYKIVQPKSSEDFS